MTRQKRSAGLVLALVLLTASLATGEGEVEDIRVRRAKLKSALERVTADFRAKIPQDAYIRGANGQVKGVDTSRADVRRIDAEWRAQVEAVRAQHNVGDNRFDELTAAMKKAGVADGTIANSGSKPKSINSDMDMTELVPGSGQKLAKTLSESGYHVEELPDRWVVKQTDTTIWKQPENVEVGSPAHRAQAQRAAVAEDSFPTKGGLFETTGGAQGTLDPEGAVLANAKKLSDACGTCDPATRLGDIDGHTIGKSVSKAAEWTGTKTDSEFFRQADALRNHRSWEEAGVCHPADTPEVKAAKIREFLEQAQEQLARAAEAGRTQSRQLDDLRTRQAAEADVKGDLETSAGVRDQQIDTKISNQETMKRLAEVDPKLAARLNGTKLTANPDGTFTNPVTNETLTPSQVREQATARTSKELVQTTEQVLKTGGETAPKPVEGAGTPPGGAKPVEPEAPAGMSKVMKAGGIFVLIYGIGEGILTGAEQAVNEERPGDSSLKTAVKAWGYSLIYGSGIGGAWDTGKQAGLESAEQFKKDLEAGKNPSAAWAKARGALWGVGAFLKGMTIDPLINGGKAVKEGLGLVGDELDAHKRSKEADAMIAKANELKAGRRRREQAEGSGRSHVRDAGAAHDRAPSLDRGPTDRGITDVDLTALVVARLEFYKLPTDEDLVGHLLGILGKEGPKGLEAAVVELSKTQGTFTGAVSGQPRLTVVVDGASVSATMRVAVGSSRVTADLSGKVDLLKHKITFRGMLTERKGAASKSGSVTFRGTFAGSGYSGSTAGSGMHSFSWKVTRTRGR